MPKHVLNNSSYVQNDPENTTGVQINSGLGKIGKLCNIILSSQIKLILSNIWKERWLDLRLGWYLFYHLGMYSSCALNGIFAAKWDMKRCRGLSLTYLHSPLSFIPRAALQTDSVLDSLHTQYWELTEPISHELSRNCYRLLSTITRPSWVHVKYLARPGEIVQRLRCLF